MTTFSSLPPSGSSQIPLVPGSKDGRGCADHDQPYTFGRRPRGVGPFPFTTRQYARLLALRGRIADGLVGADDIDPSGFAPFAPAVFAITRTRMFNQCAVCGAVVAGAYRGSSIMTCPKCAQDGGRDQAARAILLIAGVLELLDDASSAEADAAAA